MDSPERAFGRSRLPCREVDGAYWDVKMRFKPFFQDDNGPAPDLRFVHKLTAEGLQFASGCPSECSTARAAPAAPMMPPKTLATAPTISPQLMPSASKSSICRRCSSSPVP